MIRVKVRLSCGHVKFAQVPIGIDLNDKSCTSQCPEGCGERLINEQIQEENEV